MRNEYTNTQRIAMLLELGLNIHEEETRAENKRDFETAQMLIELEDCIDKLMKYIEEDK